MKNTIVNRICLLAVALVVMAACWCVTSVDVSAASKVIIGHAATGENGTKNNTPGDQTGKEVYTMAWVYSSSESSARHWTVVARCNDQTKAKKIAQVINDACNNNHVGYDQATKAERQSFYNALKEAGWDASKITKDVETTCTPMIAAAVNAAGISIATDQSASSLYTALQKTGLFTFFTDSDYVASDKYLVAGDILLSTGSHQHGATVVSSPNSVNYNAVDNRTATESSSGNYKAGKNYVLLDNLNVRYGPGTGYDIKLKSEMTADGQANALDDTKAILKKGTVVTCIKSSGDWIQIPSGWICGKQGSKTFVQLSSSVAQVAPVAAPTPAPVVSTPAPAPAKTTTTVKVKKGKNYKLSKQLYVRKGPGTNYGIKKRSQLTKSAKKSAKSGSKAMLKKGTVVTCQKVKGNWMKIPSGWVCCKPGNVKNT